MRKEIFFGAGFCAMGNIAIDVYCYQSHFFSGWQHQPAPRHTRIPPNPQIINKGGVLGLYSGCKQRPSTAVYRCGGCLGPRGACALPVGPSLGHHGPREHLAVGSRASIETKFDKVRGWVSFAWGLTHRVTSTPIPTHRWKGRGGAGDLEGDGDADGLSGGKNLSQNNKAF